MASLAAEMKNVISFCFLLSSQEYYQAITAKYGDWCNIPSSHLFIHLLKLILDVPLFLLCFLIFCSPNLPKYRNHYPRYQEVLSVLFSSFTCNFYLLLETMFKTCYVGLLLS